MIIGFIGFGKVAQNLVRLIDCKNIQFITSDENRSAKTIENISNSNVEVLYSFKEVAEKSDILISANSPANALNAAKEYGEYANGIYLDLNNISPDTTFKINDYVDDLVDGVIIGKIDSDKPILYISGEKATELLFLNDYIETKIISDKIGDASMLKMLRSTYTKSLSALLIEAVNLAKDNGLEDEFFEVLELTEGEGFAEKSKSRIRNTLNSKKRKSEELKQIIDYFNDDELIMVTAAFEKLNR